jgi:methylated-DNA-[protein]-cysteine S-methyltransferase
MPVYFQYLPSPVGRLQLVANNDALLAILWDGESEYHVRFGEMIEDTTHPILLKAKRQLKEYFDGQRKTFDLPLAFQGTEFQMKVWHALLTIPYGETRSYKQIAEQIGNVKAVRAVGAANGRNPISIITPCHRVIGAGGKLVGFTGGLDRKEILLNIEKK